MKQLIIASLIAASGAAIAADFTVPYISPTGAKYIYHMDSESARKLTISGDTIWTMKVTVEDEHGVMITIANAIADGCDLAEPAGAAAMVDNDGTPLPGTEVVYWSLANFAAGNGKLVDVVASYTCIAVMANERAASKNMSTKRAEEKEDFTHNI